MAINADWNVSYGVNKDVQTTCFRIYFVFGSFYLHVTSAPLYRLFQITAKALTAKMQFQLLNAMKYLVHLCVMNHLTLIQSKGEHPTNSRAEFCGGGGCVRSDLNVLSRRIICFLVLAGCAAEVQTRLHQPFPGQSARAGAKDTGEEGAGAFGRPAVESCSPAEESPRGPIYLAQRYMPAAPPPPPARLSSTVLSIVPLQLQWMFATWTITHTQTQNKERQGVSFSQCALFFKAHANIFALSCS